ncbi:metallophosphoesterase family protein [Rhodococcus sp. 077-4]|uniref:metallophosphoesterase family protein n=1 Tax=Rhodococcus sp. 077-4 TaxID=2789271 RepID=UPI0039F4CBE8
MRVALIADIHGNIAALDAVLEDIERQRVDSVVNLGDLLSGGLHPRRTADRLMALDFPTIAGNHDRYLLEQNPETMGRSDLLAHRQIGDDHRRWLTSLPSSLEPGQGVLAVHGTPTDDQQYSSTPSMPLVPVRPLPTRSPPEQPVSRSSPSSPVGTLICNAPLGWPAAR